ncbi:MAG TPA: hypothetical protein VH520_10650 [Streptosporangiaceae bacterium]|jgi:hypothetical protein
MSKTASQWAVKLGRLARKVGSVIAECNDATRRMKELSAAPDRYVFHSSNPPATYAEFLYRTSGPLIHEPTARARGRARAHR